MPAILVTTPTGHIGSRVVERLLAGGADVRVIARDPERLAPDVRARVDDYVIYNLSVAFDAAERVRFTAGVKNLFDTDPPFAISYDSFTGGGSSWEPRVADPRGRSLTLQAELKF